MMRIVRNLVLACCLGAVAIQCLAAPPVRVSFFLEYDPVRAFGGNTIRYYVAPEWGDTEFEINGQSYRRNFQGFIDEAAQEYMDAYPSMSIVSVGAANANLRVTGDNDAPPTVCELS